MVRSDAASLNHPSPDRLHLDALAILRAAVDAVDARQLVFDFLAGSPDLFPIGQDVRVVAAGKAALAMARGAREALADRPLVGLATIPLSAATLDGIEPVGASHPLPDSMSVHAADRALHIAADARAAEQPLLVLLSGGASAMLAAPARGLSLEDKRETIDTLMRSGAGIAQLNCVRKHLSSIKGGRLAVAAGRTVTLAISDVHTPEDDPSTIGSGPTAADPTTFAEALAMVDAFDSRVPASVREYLQRGASGRIEETIKPGDARLERSVYRVIANRRTAMEGAAKEARRRGYLVRTVDPPTSGEAREAGKVFAELALGARPSAGPVCVIASGEPTVRVIGSGRGGRNQEFVLGAVVALATHSELALVGSVGTDGVDGPTDAAGALGSSATVSRMQSLGIEIDAVLRENDAYAALARVDGLVKWGPTGTNVGDVHVVLTMTP